MAQKILSQRGLEVTPDHAKAIVAFLTNLADIALSVYLDDTDSHHPPAYFELSQSLDR